jgi:hypothetical protein
MRLVSTPRAYAPRSSPVASGHIFIKSRPAWSAIEADLREHGKRGR